MRFLSKKEVKTLVSYSFTQMGRLEQASQFPRRLRLGVGRYCRVVYLESEVLTWMEAQLSKRDKGSLTTP